MVHGGEARPGRPGTPAAGRAATGREPEAAPLFHGPWNTRFRRARAGPAAPAEPGVALTALPPGPSAGRRFGGGPQGGVDQSADGSAVVAPSPGTYDMTARKDGPTVGYCDKAVHIREKEHGQQG